MTSRRSETSHSDKIKKLFDDTGVTCIRPPGPLESESLSEELAPEEEEASLQTIEVEPEEKIIPEVVEEEPPEEFDIFPTPSLRLVLPPRVREIQKHNRLHVLPDEFNTEIDPETIPKIATTAQKVYIDQLALITGCKNYRSCLAEYWFLDTLANLLRRAQEDNMSLRSQAMLILWFCEWMKEIEYFDAADRNRMLRRFKDNMLRIARYIATKDEIPAPHEVGIYHDKNPPEDLYFLTEELPPEPLPNPTSPSNRQSSKIGLKGAKSSGTPKSPQARLSKSGIASDLTKQYSHVSLDDAFMCSLHDIIQIFHYIYDLFSTDYQFDLIQSVFTFSPDYTLIDAPYQIVTPKQLFVMPKPPKPSKPQKQPQKKTKGPEEPPTEEYLALMALKMQEEKELEALAFQQEVEWLKRSSILPLGLVATQDLFDHYWPPPPPPPPMPEPETKTKSKKK